MRIAIFLAVLAASLHADNSNHGFTASLKNCTELIGFGPVPFAAARALVPASYILVPFDGSAGLVIRASRCEAVGVDNSVEKAALVAQIGIAVISPDGTGDINNYTLSHATDHQQLAQALSQAGLPAVLDRALAYEFTPGSSGNGEVYVSVSPAVQPAWFLTGLAGPPPSGGFPVVANWWFNGLPGVLKMATPIGSIGYGSASFAPHTSKFSMLGSIIGGNTNTSFVFFNARGVFIAGSLVASIK